MSGPLVIAGRQIGPGFPVYIVAEISANHHHNFETAKRIVQAAAEAGADAVKLQTYTPDTMTIDCDNEYFVIHGTAWAGRRLFDLYGEASMPWEWHQPLADEAARLGLAMFSTPFDETAVDFLEKMDSPAYKIASFELIDLPLLRRVARTGKPVIASTGMATLGEIDEAVATLRGAGCTDFALLKCTSAYPADPADMHLRTIPHLAASFGVPVGISDHSLGPVVPVAAVTLGACIIEKHITLSRDEPGPDSSFSLEPHEFAEMVQAVRTAERALGRVGYGVSEREQATHVFRRSLFVVRDIKAGEPFTPENTRLIRPGYGLHPRHMDEVLGRTARKDLKRGTPVQWDLVGEPPADR